VNHRDRSVLVVGAGVSGLTSALCLARRGCNVTIVADRFAPALTSVVAGALWEWPPAACGRQQDQSNLSRAKAWSATSYAIFSGLAGDPATGVFLRPVNYYFRRPIAEDVFQREKMAELVNQVRQFRHDAALLIENGVHAPDLCDAYSYLTPMVDTDVYLAWLLGEVERAGCRVLQRQISGSLRGQAEELKSHFGVSAIVNCAGLGARELAEDLVTPNRGAMIRLRNDGEAMPQVTQAHCVAVDSDDQRDFLVIVPRGHNLLLLGGFAEADEWSLDIDMNNYQPIRAILQRCQAFLPTLRSAEIDHVEPVRVGLRPFRKHGVRLEREADSCIISNYGHGGSGVTFSWGCAHDVVDLVVQVLNMETRR
jgi:D-amino-acid oxidase